MFCVVPERDIFFICYANYKFITAIHFYPSRSVLESSRQLRMFCVWTKINLLS
jgi:hypothetical protein